LGKFDALYPVSPVTFGLTPTVGFAPAIDPKTFVLFVYRLLPNFEIFLPGILFIIIVIILF
jgi:hypothetical protein